MWKGLDSPDEATYCVHNIVMLPAHGICKTLLQRAAAATPHDPRQTSQYLDRFSGRPIPAKAIAQAETTARERTPYRCLIAAPGAQVLKTNAGCRRTPLPTVRVECALKNIQLQPSPQMGYRKPRFCDQRCSKVVDRQPALQARLRLICWSQKQCGTRKRPFGQFS